MMFYTDFEAYMQNMYFAHGGHLGLSANQREAELNPMTQINQYKKLTKW